PADEIAVQPADDALHALPLDLCVVRRRHEQPENLKRSHRRRPRAVHLVPKSKITPARARCKWTARVCTYAKKLGQGTAASGAGTSHAPLNDRRAVAYSATLSQSPVRAETAPKPSQTYLKF